MAELVKRSDTPITAWEPMRVVREMMRWDPFRTMREMLRWDPFRGELMLPRPDAELWMPQFEVRENATSIRFIADVPGVKREDLDISVSGNRLVISGHRESEKRTKDETVYAWEREYGQFTRAFTLPEGVDLDHITSDLRDGVLTVVAPRKAEARTRKIQIGGDRPKA